MGLICGCNTIPLVLEVNADHPDLQSIKIKSIFQSSKLTWGSFRVPFTILISRETHSYASKHDHTTSAGGCGLSENHFLEICAEGVKRKLKVPINHMACLSVAQVNAKNLCYLQYVYLFLSWISFPVWNPSIFFLFFFWQDTQSHGKAIQFSGLLPVFFPPKWPSISHQDHHYNVCQSMFKTWSCKNRN